MRVFIVITAFLLLACAQKKLVPVANGVSVDEKTYTSVYEDADVRILVRANAWKGYPTDLPDYVLPLYVEILNRGTEEVVIDPNGMILLDNRGNQYNALEPKEVAEAVRSGASVGVSVGLAYGTPHWGLGWFAGEPYSRKDVGGVINYAFIPGRIVPGAKLKGFVYFQRIPDDVNRIRFRLTYKIGEVSRSVEFKFRVEDGKGSSDNGNKTGGEGDSP